MARHRDSASRSELTETTQKQESDMRDKSEESEESVADVETVRETLDSLDMGGTSEAAEELEGSMDQAEDAGVSEFHEREGQLESLHGESEEHGSDLERRSESADSDASKVSDTRSRLHGDAADGGLAEAEDAAKRDVEFLDEQIRRAEEAREESRRELEKHQARINARSNT